MMSCSLRGRWARGASLAWPLMLAGCVNIGGGKAPAQIYGLGQAVSLASGPMAPVSAPGDVLLVSEPDTDRALGVTRILVQVDDTAMAYMKGGLWSERPARLFRNLLAETLQAQSGRDGGRRLVLLDDAEAPGRGVRLGGRLVAFGYDARSHSAVVRYDALIRASDGSLRQMRFEAVEPGVAPRVEAVVPALGRAARKVAGQVAVWVK